MCRGVAYESNRVFVLFLVTCCALCCESPYHLAHQKGKVFSSEPARLVGYDDGDEEQPESQNGN